MRIDIRAEGTRKELIFLLWRLLSDFRAGHTLDSTNYTHERGRLEASARGEPTREESEMYALAYEKQQAERSKRQSDFIAESRPSKIVQLHQESP